MNVTEAYHTGVQSFSIASTRRYMQHPISQAQIAALKVMYEARQRNSEKPYSLEEFYTSLDKSQRGELRLEDFRAGWAAGGVKLAPGDVTMMRGAYGGPKRQVRYPEALSDLSVLSHTEATNTAMTTLMGRSTAKYCGYADPDEPEEEPVTFDTRSDLSPGTRRPSSSLGTLRTGTMMGTLSGTSKQTFPKPRSAAASMTAGRLGLGNTGVLQATFQEFDPESTGQVTLEAFLTCCARAGVSMPPGA